MHRSEHPDPPFDDESDRLFRRARAMEKRVGVPRDYPRIASYYQEAADRGHWKAINNLALLYQGGLGVEQSFERSRELLERLAQMDVPEGFLGLGDIHLNGYGVPASAARGFYYIHEAAKRGHPVAQTAWGKHLLYEQDEQSGGDWLREALDQEHGEAAFELANHRLFQHDDRDGYLRYMERGAELGNVDCMVALRAAYGRGNHGVPPDSEKAARYDKMIEDSE